MAAVPPRGELGDDVGQQLRAGVARRPAAGGLPLVETGHVTPSSPLIGAGHHAAGAQPLVALPLQLPAGRPPLHARQVSIHLQNRGCR